MRMMDLNDVRVILGNINGIRKMHLFYGTLVEMTRFDVQLKSPAMQ